MLSNSASIKFGIMPKIEEMLKKHNSRVSGVHKRSVKQLNNSDTVVF